MIAVDIKKGSPVVMIGGPFFWLSAISIETTAQRIKRINEWPF
ncbi:hypothetical protein BGP_1529 [Beggiatoa sp. PS]|nr:hypothetical protein BGP_1529 [Beggiatoa sp. PS]